MGEFQMAKATLRPSVPRLRVETPDGPALLLAPLLDVLEAQAKLWRRQANVALAQGGLKQSRHEREADVCRGKAAVLEQFAKDVAEQR